VIGVRWLGLGLRVLVIGVRWLGLGRCWGG